MICWDKTKNPVSLGQFQPEKRIFEVIIQQYQTQHGTYSKALPNASDSNKQGEGHGLKLKTVMNSGYFWDNYGKFWPILKVNKLLSEIQAP